MVHPGFLKLVEYQAKLRAFYDFHSIYNSKTERDDMLLKGKIQAYDEMINLPELIKDQLKKKSEV